MATTFLLLLRDLEAIQFSFFIFIVFDLECKEFAVISNGSNSIGTFSNGINSVLTLYPFHLVKNCHVFKRTEPFLQLKTGVHHHNLDQFRVFVALHCRRQTVVMVLVEGAWIRSIKRRLVSLDLCPLQLTSP